MLSLGDPLQISPQVIYSYKLDSLAFLPHKVSLYLLQSLPESHRIRLNYAQVTAVTRRSRSPSLVPIESLYTTSYDFQ